MGYQKIYRFFSEECLKKKKEKAKVNVNIMGEN